MLLSAMEFPRLETFIRVAESGSFNKAAEIGNITSTAVIKQMNLLEEEVGVKLFDRTHRGLRLTKAGESFLKDSRYIIKYSKDSVNRARKAMQEADSLIRIGTSPLTPAEAFTELWPEIRKYCPDMRFRIITFENTPENAAGILANLGDNIDVVVGIFDETLLNLRKCDGFILYDVPISVAVSLDHPLASKEELEIEDLYGQNLLLMHRGWSHSVDELRNDISAHHPEINIVDFDFYDVDIFNRCSTSVDCLMAIDKWQNVHPMLKIIPVKWKHTIPYGIFYSYDPSPVVGKLLDAVSSIDFSSYYKK